MLSHGIIIQKNAIRCLIDGAVAGSRSGARNIAREAWNTALSTVLSVVRTALSHAIIFQTNAIHCMVAGAIAGIGSVGRGSFLFRRSDCVSHGITQTNVIPQVFGDCCKQI